MENQIKRYMPSSEELEGLDNYISDIPDLHKLIEENDYSLELIIKGIDSIKIDEGYKTGIKQLFIALQKSSIAKEIYKYSTFKNQEIIDNLLRREEQYKFIIKQQAIKYKDNNGIDDMNKMFSKIKIIPENDKKISLYTSKKIKDIKKYEEFKPIFTEQGERIYSRQELIDMKKDNKKGIRFNNVDSIKVNNINDDIIIK